MPSTLLGMMTPKLLSLCAMARRLRVTQKWLREEAESGKIPHLKADNRFLFDPETVEKLLLQRAREGGGAK